MILKTHGRYHYSPISDRPHYEWPGGKLHPEHRTAQPFASVSDAIEMRAVSRGVVEDGAAVP